MDKPLFDTCPVCHSKDSIRKVSSIVSSENLHGYMAGPMLGGNGDFGITISHGSSCDAILG